MEKIGVQHFQKRQKHCLFKVFGYLNRKSKKAAVEFIEKTE